MHSGMFGAAALNAAHALIGIADAFLHLRQLKLPDRPCRRRDPPTDESSQTPSFRRRLRRTGRSRSRLPPPRSSTSGPSPAVPRRQRIRERFAGPGQDRSPGRGAGQRIDRLAPGQDRTRSVPYSSSGFATPEGAELQIELQGRARPAMTDSGDRALQLAANAFEDTVGAPARQLDQSTLPVAGLVGRGFPTLATDFGIESEAAFHALNKGAMPGCRSTSASRPCARSSDGSESLASAPFVSPLAEELLDDVLARFLRYVRVDTRSPGESTCSTSRYGNSSTCLGCSWTNCTRSDGRRRADRELDRLSESARDDRRLGHRDSSRTWTPIRCQVTGVQPIVHKAWGGRPIVLPGRCETSTRSEELQRLLSG